MKKPAQGINTGAQDSNPGPLTRKSEALPREPLRSTKCDNISDKILHTTVCSTTFVENQVDLTLTMRRLMRYH